MLLPFLICGPIGGVAQGLPQTEIWLAELGSDGFPAAPVRITDASGYHNQPHFSEDSQTLFFSAEADESQTDVLVYNLTGHQRHVVNDSPYSDFSPTPIPGQSAISVVRVEADSRQRLWRIDLESAEERVLLERIEPVGYHAWLTDELIALFILGETFDLHLARVGRDESTEVTKNIGRTLRVNRRTGELYFVNKAVEPWEIAALDPVTRKAESVMSLFPLIEDFELDSHGRLWTGNGSKLYVSDDEFRHWVLAAELGDFGIDRISRLSASPDGRWLAIVSSP